MTKAKIAKINKLVATHNPAWRAHGYYVILKQDEWLPVLLIGGGSGFDKNWYKAMAGVLPVFKRFGHPIALSGYDVAIDDPRGAFTIDVDSFEEVAKRVAETIEAKIGQLAHLTPLENFRKNAYDWWAKKLKGRYPTDYRLEQDLASAACAAGDLEKARYHCEHGLQVLEQIDTPDNPTPPLPFAPETVCEPVFLWSCSLATGDSDPLRWRGGPANPA